MGNCFSQEAPQPVSAINLTPGPQSAHKPASVPTLPPSPTDTSYHALAYFHHHAHQPIAQPHSVEPPYNPRSFFPRNLMKDTDVVLLRLVAATYDACRNTIERSQSLLQSPEAVDILILIDEATKWLAGHQRDMNVRMEGWNVDEVHTTAAKMASKTRIPLDRLRTACNYNLHSLEVDVDTDNKIQSAGTKENRKDAFERVKEIFVETLARFQGIVKECVPADKTSAANTTSP